MPLLDFNRMNKCYQVRVRCTNCGQIQDLKVPKGERKEQFLKNGKCEVCGCVEVLVLREGELDKEKEKEDKEKMIKSKRK